MKINNKVSKYIEFNVLYMYIPIYKIMCMKLLLFLKN